MALPRRRGGPPGQGSNMDCQVVRQVIAVGVVAPLPLTLYPNTVEADGARVPFQVSLMTLIVNPLTVYRPLQSWAIVCPLARVNWAFQPVMVVVPLLRTVNSPW